MKQRDLITSVAARLAGKISKQNEMLKVGQEISAMGFEPPQAYFESTAKGQGEIDELLWLLEWLIKESIATK